MKKGSCTRRLIAVALVVLGSGSILSAEEGGDSEPLTTVFTVYGMRGRSCAVAVERAVRRLDGVEEADASHEEAEAVVRYDPQRVTPEEIEAAIAEVGYGAELADKEEDTE